MKHVVDNCLPAVSKPYNFNMFVVIYFLILSYLQWIHLIDWLNFTALFFFTVHTHWTFENSCISLFSNFRTSISDMYYLLIFNEKSWNMEVLWSAGDGFVFIMYIKPYFIYYLYQYWWIDVFFIYGINPILNFYCIQYDWRCNSSISELVTAFD